MDTETNEYIVMATTKCKKDFCCLVGQKNCICEIEGSNGSHTVSIKPNGNPSCDYLLHLGSSIYCLCPTRNEIYHCWNM